MSTLYEIEQSYMDFLTAVDNGEIPEEAIADTLAAIEGEFAAKAENIACLVKNLSADEKSLAAEIKALQERKASKTALISRLKDTLYNSMLAIGTRRIDTARVLVTIAKNRPTAEIKDEGTFIEWAITNKPEYLRMAKPEIAKTAVYEALASGTVIEGATIVQKEGVRIK